jgi:hypothetical protein
MWRNTCLRTPSQSPRTVQRAAVWAEWPDGPGASVPAVQQGVRRGPLPDHDCLRPAARHASARNGNHYTQQRYAASLASTHDPPSTASGFPGRGAAAWLGVHAGPQHRQPDSVLALLGIRILVAEAGLLPQRRADQLLRQGMLPLSRASVAAFTPGRPSRPPQPSSQRCSSIVLHTLRTSPVQAGDPRQRRPCLVNRAPLVASLDFDTQLDHANPNVPLVEVRTPDGQQLGTQSDG